MKVSIVAPVYNVAPYIEQFARSIFEQTLDDIEYVFVDDCTPDSSIEILLSVLEEYPQRKPNVKIIHHKTNMGLAASRKDGCMSATGEYIINIDSDDYADRTMAEKMYVKAVENGADMVLCGFWWYGKNDKTFVLPVPVDSIENTESIKEATLNRRGWPNVWCRMIKKSILMSDEMRWPKEDYAEDVVISTITTYYANKIESIQEPLYHYCYNNGSITYQSPPERILKKYNDFLANNDIVIDFYEQKGLTESCKRGLMVNKMYARNELLLLTSKCKYRRKWRDTYPELNKVMLQGNELFTSSTRDKIWYYAVSLGLFPSFKKILLSTKLRPKGIWRSGAHNYITS